MFWFHLMVKGRRMAYSAYNVQTLIKIKRNNMYVAIGGILGILWVLGMVFNFRLDGAIYILLAAAVVMMFFALRQWWQQPA
jgi:hypothetical protein